MQTLRAGALILVAALAAACAAPEPAAWGDVEAGDTGFHAAPPPDREAAAAVIAQQPAWTLEDVLRLADLANPELAADRRNIDLATAALWQAKLYPNPSFLFELEEWAVADDDEFGKTVAGVSLPLVIGGRIDAATRVAEAERETTAMEFLARRRALLSNVKRAFIRVLAAERRTELAEETVELARTLRQTASDRFAAQAVPEMEVLKATVNQAGSEADLREARRDLSVARRELLGLVGTTDREDARLVGELRTGFAEVAYGATRAQALESHPALRAAHKRVDAAMRAIELERAKRWQDWDLDVLGGRSPEGQFILEGGIRIPLQIRDKNQAGIRAAEVRAAQAQLELEAAVVALESRLGQAYDAFVAARDRVEIFHSTILPQAEKALDQTREGYQVGKFEYLDLLDAQRTLAEARLGHAAAVAELNETAATLEELGGVRLTPDEGEERE